MGQLLRPIQIYRTNYNSITYLSHSQNFIQPNTFPSTPYTLQKPLLRYYGYHAERDTSAVSRFHCENSRVRELSFTFFAIMLHELEEIWEHLINKDFNFIVTKKHSTLCQVWGSNPRTLSSTRT